MSLLPIDSRPLRRVVFRTGAMLYSRQRLVIALAAVLAMGCVLSASAQLPGFTMTNSGPITLVSQQYGPVSVTITPVGGFSSGISLSCGNMPAYSSCVFPNANSGVTVSGSPVTESIVINTSEINNYQSQSTPLHRSLSRIALGTLFAPAAFLALFARKRGWKIATASRLMLCLLALYPVVGLVGCAAVKPNSTPVGTYNLVITGAVNSTSASTVVTLHVT